MRRTLREYRRNRDSWDALSPEGRAVREAHGFKYPRHPFVTALGGIIAVVGTLAVLPIAYAVTTVIGLEVKGWTGIFVFFVIATAIYWIFTEAFERWFP